MCRWVLSEAGIGHSQKQIGEFLGALRESQGGHGDGLWFDGELYKPVRRKDAARAFRATEAGVALWHTRLASVGEVTPELIHPFCFQASEGDRVVVLAHNGTDFTLGQVASAFEVSTGEHWSDSKVYAHLLACGRKIPGRLVPSTGVWVYSLNGGTTWMVDVKRGDCMYSPSFRVWASVLPVSLFPDAYKVEEGKHAVGTIPPKREEVCFFPVKRSGSVSVGFSDYFRDYREFDKPEDKVDSLPLSDSRLFADRSVIGYHG